MRKILRVALSLLLVLAAALPLAGCYTTVDYGYIDRQGQWVTEPIFQQAYPFHDGYAVCMWGIEGSVYGYGLVDHTGEWVTDMTYKNMRGYYDGVLVAQDASSGNWSFYDIDGNLLFGEDAVFYDASVFVNGLAPVSEIGGDNLYGYLDRDGNMAIQPQFDLASVFDADSGLAMVRRGGATTGKYGFIDRTGAMVIDYTYSYAGTFSEGFAPVKISTVSGALDWAFIDTTGQVVLQGDGWGYCRGFSEGLAAVCVGNPDDEDEAKWGFVDKNGNWAVEPRYAGAMSFSEGLAAVNQGTSYQPEWGYIDASGAFVLQPIYEVAGQFSEGVAPVYDYEYND